MELEYIIGVDGGGTKTDYLIFTTEGKLVDVLRVGSRSHEVLAGGFVEVEETVLSDIDHLLRKNNIAKSSIAAAAFGMAGIDTPSQLAVMKQILQKASFRKFAVANDSILGIKAGCPSGIGICSINGTGTVASGIDKNGNTLQVGGIGIATGDYAGGFFIASLAVRAVYDYYFRCGEKTVLSEKLMTLFGLVDPAKLLNAISEKFYLNREFDREVMALLFEAAGSGDKVAEEIVCEVARQLAKSVAGCMKNLCFEEVPEIVLAGSVWTKSNCPLLLSHFKEYVFLYAGIHVKPILLQVKPAVGAVIWALELACDHPATREQREIIMRNMETHREKNMEDRL